MKILLGFLPSWRRRRPWVSFPSLEASLRCVTISAACLVLVVVSGRKPRCGVGSARWRRPRRRLSLESIVFGDTAWRSFRCAPPVLPLSKIDDQRRYVNPSPVSPRRRLPQDGSSPTIHLPSFFQALMVVSASTRDVRPKLFFYGGYRCRIERNIYRKIHVGDLIQFGQSSRRYIFQGPCELMSPGKDMQKLRETNEVKIRQDMLDSEVSCRQAKTQAALAEGVSWGMPEDAPEEFEEDEADEITWQTYRGQLTDRQEKTRGKIIKRMEKVASMKIEIDAIRVKDISQGGLSQGQQTRIALNEQRISQIMGELENLEVTLNDSIQESIAALAGKPKCGRHKASLEEDVASDDDEFYDRTKKKSSSQQSSGQQSVETADNLLEKKNIITNGIEGKKKLLEEEKNKLAQRHDVDLEDALDVYMSGLLSQLAHDNIIKIQKELSDLQAELDRVVYLLKVADPVEEAAHKRDLKPREANPQTSDDNRGLESQKQEKNAQIKISTESSKDSFLFKTEVDKSAEVETDVSRKQEKVSKPTFTIPKPQASKSKGKELKQKCLLGPAPARPDFREACPD